MGHSVKTVISHLELVIGRNNTQQTPAVLSGTDVTPWTGHQSDHTIPRAV